MGAAFSGPVYGDLDFPVQLFAFIPGGPRRDGPCRGRTLSISRLPRGGVRVSSSAKLTPAGLAGQVYPPQSCHWPYATRISAQAQAAVSSPHQSMLFWECT